MMNLYLGLLALTLTLTLSLPQAQTLHLTDIAELIDIAEELTDIAELIREETDGNVIIEPDKNTMKCLMELKQRALSFDIENSLSSLLGFRKKIYKKGRYKSQKIIDIMGFSTINIHCNVISGAKDNGKDTDILYTFNLTEPPGYSLDKYYSN